MVVKNKQELKRPVLMRKYAIDSVQYIFINIPTIGPNPTCHLCSLLKLTLTP